MARTKRKVNPVLPSVPLAPVLPQKRIYMTGGYVRLSLEDSGKPGTDTMEKQEELVREFIDAQPDMQFCGLYRDNGHTGTTFARPGFEQLMEDIKKGKIDCVVVKDLSRFGRNYLETGNYLMRIFPFLDVRFVAINDQFDTLTAERSADGYIIPLKNIINEAYSRDLSKKIRPALDEKKRKGEFIGSWASYGYRKCAEDRHKIEPDPETAPIVREIFQWRVEGLSYMSIVRRLNERQIPSPSQYRYLKGEMKSDKFAKTAWSTFTVKHVLTCEVYLGHLVQGRKRTGLAEGHKSRKLPKEEWIVVRNTHEPLIDEETFFKVQRIEAENHDAYYEKLGRHDHLGATPNILRGLVFCADCKRPLVRYKNVTNKGKNLFYTFICPTHAVNPADCPNKSIHETLLKEILWDTLRQEIEATVNMEELVRQYGSSRESAGLVRAMEQEVFTAQQDRDRAQRLRDSLFESYLEKLVTEQEYTELRKQYQEEINPWLKAFGRYRGETELSEEMAHELIQRVEVDADDNVAVTLRYRDEYASLVCLIAGTEKAVAK